MSAADSASHGAAEPIGKTVRFLTRNCKGRPLKLRAEELAGRKHFFNQNLIKLARGTLILAKNISNSECGFFMKDAERWCRGPDKVALQRETPEEHRHRRPFLRRILFLLNNLFSKSIMVRLAPIVEDLYYRFFNLEEVGDRWLMEQLTECIRVSCDRGDLADNMAED